MPLQILLDATVYAAGFGVGAIILRGKDPWLAMSLSYPLGLVVLFSLVLLLVSSGMPMSPSWLWVGVSAMAFVCCAIALKAGGWSIVIPFVAGGIVYAAASAICGYAVLVVLPNDAMWHILLGKMLAASGEISSVSPFFSARSVVLVLLNGIATILGDGDYWYSMVPLQMVGLVGTLIYFFGRTAMQLRLSSPWWIAGGVAFAGVLGLAQSPLTVALMVKAHLLFGVLVTGFLCLAWLEMSSGDGRYGALAGLFLAAIVPVRIEGAFFVPLLAVLWGIFRTEAPSREFRACFVAPLAGIGWSLIVWSFPANPVDPNFQHLNNQIVLLEPSWIGLAVAINGGALAVLMAVRSAPWRRLALAPEFVVLVASLVAASVVSLASPEKMGIDFYALITHLTHIRWGDGWFLILIVAVLVLAGDERALGDRFLACGVLAFLLMIFVAGYVRKPFHTIPSDSANRMLLQIFPVGLFLVGGYGMSLVARWQRHANRTTDN